MTQKNRNVRIGDVYEVKTFAGVTVHQKILRLEKTYSEGECYLAALMREDDVLALKDAGVPYSGKEDPVTCEGVVYPFQIVKKVGPKRRRRRAKKKKE